MYNTILDKIIKKENIRGTLAELRECLKSPGELKSFKSERLYDISLFTDLLQDNDPKVRKNAAVVLGLLEEKECVEALFLAYMDEKTLFVRSAYLKALKNYDYSSYEKELNERRLEIERSDYDEADIKHIADELKILKSMCAQKSFAGHSFHDPEKPVKIILTTGRDTIDVLYDTVVANPNAIKADKIFCGVQVMTEKIKNLSKIRIYKDVLFPVNNMKTVNKQEIPETVIKGDFLQLLAKLHNNEKEPYRFRVTSNTLDTQKIGSRIQALSHGHLINEPSDYEVEIKLVRGKDDKYGIFVKLHTLKDKRFKYRSEYVAASMNPVNASMMIAMVRDYLKPEAQILDPFCGVGTLLIERNLLVPAREIYGIDIYGQAVDGARNNTQYAGMKINYINRDYFDFEHSYKFDEIITDMPDLKPEETENLYRKFFEKSRKHLSENGIMILYSREKNLIKKYLRLNQEYKLLREFVFNSKDDRSVFVISYTSSK